MSFEIKTPYAIITRKRKVYDVEFETVMFNIRECAAYRPSWSTGGFQVDSRCVALRCVLLDIIYVNLVAKMLPKIYNYCLGFYQGCLHPCWGMIFWNGHRVHRYILYANFRIFPLVLCPPPSFRTGFYFICSRRRVAVAWCRMIWLVLLISSSKGYKMIKIILKVELD